MNEDLHKRLEKIKETTAIRYGRDNSIHSHNLSVTDFEWLTQELEAAWKELQEYEATKAHHKRMSKDFLVTLERETKLKAELEESIRRGKQVCDDSQFIINNLTAQIDKLVKALEANGEQ